MWGCAGLVSTLAGLARALKGKMSATILKGWIKPLGGETDVTIYRRELESLGVDVGTWDLIESEFQECKVSPHALDKLDRLWGSKYIWGLI